MVIAIVNFQGTANEPIERVRERFAATAPRFRVIPGLLRKNFLYDPATGVGGGSYLWTSRAAAEAYYDDAWRERMTGLVGNTPTVQYFESPVEVDNAVGRISTS